VLEEQLRHDREDLLGADAARGDVGRITVPAVGRRRPAGAGLLDGCGFVPGHCWLPPCPFCHPLIDPPANLPVRLRLRGVDPGEVDTEVQVGAARRHEDVGQAAGEPVRSVADATRIVEPPDAPRPRPLGPRRKEQSGAGAARRAGGGGRPLWVVEAAEPIDEDVDGGATAGTIL
jgi:hypothetical protein